jgi:hypothetical protein
MTVFVGFSQKTTELSYAAFLKEYNALLTKQPASNYRITVQNSNYMNETDAKPFDQSSSKLLVTKESCFAFESKEGLMLQNDEIRVNVDTASKTIYLLKPIEMKSLNQVSDLSALDSAGLKVKKNISTERTGFVIEQTIENTSFRKVKIEFSNKTSQIVRIEIHYWPGDYFSEKMDEQVLETPRIVYDYVDFKKIETSSVDKRYQVSSWINDKEELLASLANAGYVIKDLRVKR